MERSLRFDIPRSRAEYPMLAVALVFVFVGWAIHYGFFGWTGGGIWLLIVMPVLIYFYLRGRGSYFVEADSNGIRWRKDLISRYINIPWDYLQRVDYLEYEINFMMKETAQVVCFPTSGLTDEQTEALKECISDVVKARMDSGQL